jgi:hypothetical protein
MGNIKIFGPRGSGKTTYLAALAYWNQNRTLINKNSIFTIQPIGDEATELADKAADILLEGLDFEPSMYKEIDELPLYSFLLEVKSGWQTPEQINLVVRDYPGEFFKEMGSASTRYSYQEYIDELLMDDVSGCLIMLTEWVRGQDKYYLRVLKEFITQMDNKGRLNNMKIAVCMSKCERGELWPGRLDPVLDIFDIHLRETKAFLQKNINSTNLEFFALSTFGVLHRNDPRPNRVNNLNTNRQSAVLRETHRWHPYGMIAPLYWLSTGKKMRKDA